MPDASAVIFLIRDVESSSSIPHPRRRILFVHSSSETSNPLRPFPQQSAKSAALPHPRRRILFVHSIRFQSERVHRSVYCQHPQNTEDLPANIFHTAECQTPQQSSSSILKLSRQTSFSFLKYGTLCNRFIPNRLPLPEVESFRHQPVETVPLESSQRVIGLHPSSLLGFLSICW